MDTSPIWISHGHLVRSPQELSHVADSEDQLLHREGVVKIRVSEKGTTVRWSVFASNWASLYFTMDWLRTSPGPFRLEYFLVGWFDETYAEAHEAVDRIHTLLSKSDVHIMSRTFVKEADPKLSRMPDLLQDALTDRTVNPDFAIDLALDPKDDRFKVMRVGDRTPIAELFGATPVAYPCVNGGSYDQIVSEIYPRVIRTGEPHYGHVFAAMNTPDRTVRWYPYQRVVLPHLFPDGTRGVTVVSQVANVDIQVV